jgi:protein-disulfide isomerase
MMSARRRRIPWELAGLFVVVAVYIVGAVLWFRSPRGQGQIQEPTTTTLQPSAGLPSGETSEGFPYIGVPDAPVKVREIADFQCPFCRQFAEEDFQTFEEGPIAEGTAQWIWVMVGFDGAESVAAGVAGLCAAKQGLFWPMYDWLYANASPVLNSGAFSRDRLVKMGEAAGLDSPSFVACLDDPSMTQVIRNSETYARKLGVSATPTFVIGDRLVEGLDMDTLRAAIEAAGGE